MKPAAFPCLTLLALVSFQPSLQAQTFGGMNPSGPAVSPYLNLARPATLPGVNYYGLVQPQMQFQSAINSLQANQFGLMSSVNGGSGGAGMAGYGMLTGHPIVFGYYSHYYPSRMGGMGMGGMGMGGMGMGGMGSLSRVPGSMNMYGPQMLYSPYRNLGGVGMGTGLGGIAGQSLMPGMQSGNPSRGGR